MEVFGQDMKIGDFVLSEHGLMLSSFGYDGKSEDDLGLNHATEEEYINTTAVPVYLGAKYSSKLELQLSIVKKYCDTENDTDYFTEREIRDVLRSLTGMRTYKWVEIIGDVPEEKLYYKCRTVEAKLQRIGGLIYGLILTMECDSPYAWSREYEYYFDLKADEEFRINNTSDDLYNYYSPFVEIINSNGGIDKFVLTNLSDNNRETIISPIHSQETITMDCNREIITSTETAGRWLMESDNFNYHWIKFIPGQNTFKTNSDIKLRFKCRFPRKVGIQQ